MLRNRPSVCPCQVGIVHRGVLVNHALTRRNAAKCLKTVSGSQQCCEQMMDCPTLCQSKPDAGFLFSGIKLVTLLARKWQFWLRVSCCTSSFRPHSAPTANSHRFSSCLLVFDVLWTTHCFKPKFYLFPLKLGASATTKTLFVYTALFKYLEALSKWILGGLCILWIVFILH